MSTTMIEQKEYCRLTQLDELPIIDIEHPLFAAKVLIQGAQLIHFAPKFDNAQNWLWLSEQAKFKKGKSVRGGIPICWPWFGNLEMNPLPVHAHIHSDLAHGFVRNQGWQIKSIVESELQIELVMSFASNPGTEEIWPYQFELTAHFLFTEKELSVELRSHNLSEKNMPLSQALHSYLPTSDITNTSIAGLDQQPYLETLEEYWPEKKQLGPVTFEQETDRVYLPHSGQEHSKHYYLLELNTPERKYLLENHNSQSCVIWNPWIEKSKRLSDFADDAYQRMFCVETANCAKDFITLKPQQSHSLAFNLRAK